MRYPDLIFDLDDTLIESFTPYASTHQRVARELGWRVPSKEELIVYLNTWEETLARLWPGADLSSFMARYDELGDECPYPAIDGVCEMLANCRDAGHRLWIVTKRSRRRLSQRMAQAGVAESVFDAIYCIEEQPAPKPDPRCFAPVWAAGTGAAPETSVYLGDRLDDWRASAAAGVRFLGVGTGPEGLAVFADDVGSADLLASAALLPTWLSDNA